MIRLPSAPSNQHGSNTSHWLGRWLRRCRNALIPLALAVIPVASDAEESIGQAVGQMIRDSCTDCHDRDSDTGLNLTEIGTDLSDLPTFQTWVRVFDRVERGEMPPPEAAELSPAERNLALSQLGESLRKASPRSREDNGRVPSRRLTSSEFENALHDLLGIEGDLKRHLPPESRSGTFDVVASKQEMSGVHVKAMLKVVDLALDEAIQLGTAPRMTARQLYDSNSKYMKMWLERPLRMGGGTIFKSGEDIVTFRGENHVFRSDHHGLRIPVAGRYRVTIQAAAYQPRSSITVSLKRQNDAQGESELAAAWDLVGSKIREVSTTLYLRPDDFIYVSADELDPGPGGEIIYNSQPASSFPGEGVRIRTVVVEGPLESAWPPARTRDLLGGIRWERRQSKTHHRQVFYPVLSDSPNIHLREVIRRFGSKALLRDLSDPEIDSLVSLAGPADGNGDDFANWARIPLRSVLLSPEFIYQTGPAGPLDDIDLSRRLASFLWRSLPDDELIGLAHRGVLSDPETLASQVNRMLADSKSERFVNDFLDQWLGLDRIDATTPDRYLYPEYDDVLRNAMLAETRRFFTHLIEGNLAIGNLIDSNFTFLNRRLAEHYGIPSVKGERMRKVPLSPHSIRGGLLSHAAILKVTANGTVTSPIKRGNFVLTNLLGLPPNPPPPNAGTIEPDTRGATSIREILEKHQAVEACGRCHRIIDPPGFSMECFDPVGQYRERYRLSKGVTREFNAGLRYSQKDYDIGPPVESSGVTDGGTRFNGFQDYRRLLTEQHDQVAKNLLSQLVAFATGAEVQFADRDQINQILDKTHQDGYPLKTVIHQLVASPLFRNR